MCRKNIIGNDIKIKNRGIMAKEKLELTWIGKENRPRLKRLELIVKDKDKYKGNIEIMHGYMPMRKTK